MSSHHYALAALSHWGEPRYEWVGSFDVSSAYMDIVDESGYIALGYLTPFLGRGE
jgi:hypothetical protein